MQEWILASNFAPDSVYLGQFLPLATQPRKIFPLFSFLYLSVMTLNKFRSAGSPENCLEVAGNKPRPPQSWPNSATPPPWPDGNKVEKCEQETLCVSVYIRIGVCVCISVWVWVCKCECECECERVNIFHKFHVTIPSRNSEGPPLRCSSELPSAAANTFIILNWNGIGMIPMRLPSTTISVKVGTGKEPLEGSGGLHQV